MLEVDQEKQAAQALVSVLVTGIAPIATVKAPDCSRSRP
jgi:hypothetical protein